MVQRRNEAVATDTLWSDTPVIFGGQVGAQVYLGITTLVTDVEGIKMDKQFVNILEDNKCHHGAPSKLIIYHAPAEVKNKVKDILHSVLKISLEK
jgi:hypothetical protein